MPQATLLLATAFLTACAAEVEEGSVLVGRSGPAVQKALGDPNRIRRQASAQIWQYAGPACVSDFFL
ncbi:MAG: hypothetical protein GDA41_05720 [Rhodospirillales bacterium]|nr:hypothetical protein [Rhodospirillales bacterium]